VDMVIFIGLHLYNKNVRMFDTMLLSLEKSPDNSVRAHTHIYTKRTIKETKTIPH